MNLLSLFKKAWRTSNVVIARHLRRQPRYMPTLVLFVTNRCNLRCRMCGVRDLPCAFDREQELTTDDWKKVITSAASELGTFLTTISGGEPLLRPDIFELIGFAAQSGISVHLCSNATLLTEDKILRLKEAGLASISISLESPEEMLHNYLQAEDTFSKVVQSLKDLRRLAPNIRVGINFLITKKNYLEMVPMLEFARSLDMHQIKYSPIHANLLHRRKAMAEYDDLFFEKEDLADLSSELEKLRKLCKKSGLRSSSDAFFRGIADYYEKPRQFMCYAGYSVCAIDPTGNVAPCCDKDSHFNVKQKRLAEIWRDPEFYRLRNLVHHCNVPCWDATYTEMSLMLQPRSLLLNVFNLLKDVKFYFPSGSDSTH
ncbi:MAG TPA: radical SAM protein [Candidatus Hydrogenedentes bacterium]|nr:radical SAM protein [Candidatus Hydrogenedentota bacterium]HOR51284.1 radical SAM protein [Candidatus Hydrogenedentota bacterium]HPK25183.1 radical SAM protein [Candidatus Hydrogenedentota bacterium]HQB03968.1 radical SAM protein [Candidatus Hydrogenedentota bacterium]